MNSVKLTKPIKECLNKYFKDIDGEWYLELSNSRLDFKKKYLFKYMTNKTIVLDDDGQIRIAKIYYDDIRERYFISCENSEFTETLEGLNETKIY